MIAVPSRLPLASSFPSLEKSSETQKPVCPFRRWTSRRVATSQTFSGLRRPAPISIHLLPKPATRYFPSGEYASAPTGPVYSVTWNPGRSVAPGNRAISVPAWMSHSETYETLVCPPCPVASRLLSVGENATLKTRLLPPADRTRTSRPVAASQRRTLAPSAAAISCPSDEKRATQQSVLECSNG